MTSWPACRCVSCSASSPSRLSETWLISITPASRRGRIMGLYSAIASGGFAIGPLSLGLVGTEGWPLFIIAIMAGVSGEA